MKIKDYLDGLGINFRSIKHPPVYTAEEAEKHYADLKGINTKNLFLKDRKSKKFYLVLIPANQRADMDALGKKLNEKLKFANPDDMMRLLGLTPGSVSPFGLINDKEHTVELVVDKTIWEASHLGFHPNVNTETLEISREGFHKYAESLQNKLTLL